MATSAMGEITTEPGQGTPMGRNIGEEARQLSRHLLSLWVPSACDLCGRDLSAHDYPRLCVACAGDLGDIGHTGRCPVCDHPLFQKRCPQCAEGPFPVERLRTLFIHEGPGRSLLHHYKFRRKKPHGEILANLAWLMFREELKWAQLLVPVPIAKRALWERDFCPVTLPVKTLSKRSAVPWLPLLEKIPGGSVQHLQGRHGRKNSPLRFRLSPKCRTGSLAQPPERILLVDDVVTTGSTLAQGAQLIQSAFPGARIRALAFARTPMRLQSREDPEEDREEHE